MDRRAAATIEDLRPGMVVAGKYRLGAELGGGGMGLVFEAVHLELGERVALKFLRSEDAPHDERVTRFVREAWAAAKVKNEHVVRVIDVDRLDDDVPFFVMEYLEGRDLGQVLAAEGALEIGRAVDYVLQAAEGLAEAHRVGIVHRDLKPSNLFLTRRQDGSPCVKLLDFGISKFSDGTKLTQTDSLIGSPIYMAPEQLLNASDVDERADVWSLGVVLYELIAGVAPFEAETVPKIVAAVLKVDPPLLTEIDRRVPTRLALVVRECLQKQSDDRHPDLAVFADALAPLGSDSAARSAAFVRGVLDGEGPPSGSGAWTPPPPPRSSRPVARRAVGADTAAPVTQSGDSKARRPVWAAAAMGAAAVAIALLLWGGSDPAPAGSAAGRAVEAPRSVPAPVEPETTGQPASHPTVEASAEPAPEPTEDPGELAREGSETEPTAARETSDEDESEAVASSEEEDSASAPDESTPEPPSRRKAPPPRKWDPYRRR